MSSEGCHIRHYYLKTDPWYGTACVHHVHVCTGINLDIHVICGREGCHPFYETESA